MSIRSCYGWPRTANFQLTPERLDAMASPHQHVITLQRHYVSQDELTRIGLVAEAGPPARVSTTRVSPRNTGTTKWRSYQVVFRERRPIVTIPARTSAA